MDPNTEEIRAGEQRQRPRPPMMPCVASIADLEQLLLAALEESILLVQENYSTGMITLEERAEADSLVARLQQLAERLLVVLR